MRVIRDNKELEGGEKGLWGVTGDHKRIQEVTEGYSWLKGATTGGHRVTENYKLVLFILELFSFILHFIYKTFHFFNFSVLLEMVIKDW